MAARFCSPSISSPMPSASATASCCSPTGRCAASARSPSCAPARRCPRPRSRRCSLRSPEPAPLTAPLRPLLAKELWGVVGGRALWCLLLILCPLVGYSFFQAAALYGESSAAARDAPVLAAGLSPLDGVL